MTAKETYQQLIDSINALNEIGVNTTYHRKLLSQLCEQLCKEQREICSKVNVNHEYDSGLEVEIAIANAKMPEL